MNATISESNHSPLGWKITALALAPAMGLVPAQATDRGLAPVVVQDLDPTMDLPSAARRQAPTLIRRRATHLSRIRNY